MSANAAGDAADAQSSADKAAIAAQNQRYQQAQTNLSPYMGAGANALNLQTAYLNGDTSGFTNSPDYQFAVQQGTKALDAGAASKGNLWGGGADADRISLGQGLATQYANNYWNKISGLANTGLGAATSLANFGQNNANSVGGYLQNSGQAQASGTVGQANAYGNVLGQLGQLYGQNPIPAGGSTSSYSLGGNINSYGSLGSSTPASGAFNFATASGGY
jgi:hypothetical protein